MADRHSRKKKINWSAIAQSVKEGVESVANVGGKLTNLATKAGVAYIGYNALKHPAGALTGLVALNLANSGNLAAGAAGVTALTGLGVLSMVPPGGFPLGDLDLDPCPLPPDAFIGNLPLLLIRLVQRSLCLANWAKSQQPPPEPPATNGLPGGGGGTGAWISA